MRAQYQLLVGLLLGSRFGGRGLSEIVIFFIVAITIFVLVAIAVVANIVLVDCLVPQPVVEQDPVVEEAHLLGLGANQVKRNPGDTMRLLDKARRIVVVDAVDAPLLIGGR